MDETGLDGAGYCTADGKDPLLAVMMEMFSASGGGRDSFSSGPSFFTAVEEKWGMKLKPEKAQVDVLVVDHVERPSEN